MKITLIHYICFICNVLCVSLILPLALRLFTKVFYEKKKKVFNPKKNPVLRGKKKKTNYAGEEIPNLPIPVWDDLL